MFKFDSVDKFTIKDRGIEYIVKNPLECSDFTHLLGCVVVIDGVEYTVKGVDRFLHCPPWRKGEHIGLLV